MVGRPRTRTVCHCGKPEAAKGLCWPHYQQARRAAMPKRPPCHDDKPHAWLITGKCRICGATR